MVSSGHYLGLINHDPPFTIISLGNAGDLGMQYQFEKQSADFLEKNTDLDTNTVDLDISGWFSLVLMFYMVCGRVGCMKRNWKDCLLWWRHGWTSSLHVMKIYSDIFTEWLYTVWCICMSVCAWTVWIYKLWLHCTILVVKLFVYSFLTDPSQPLALTIVSHHPSIINH